MADGVVDALVGEEKERKWKLAQMRVADRAVGGRQDETRRESEYAYVRVVVEVRVVDQAKGMDAPNKAAPTGRNARYYCR